MNNMESDIQASGHTIIERCKNRNLPNLYWKVMNNKTNETYYMMNCSHDKYFIFSEVSLNNVLYVDGITPRWLVRNGYISADINGKKDFYLHKHLIECHDIKKSKSDRIFNNMNKMDCRIENFVINDNKHTNTLRDKISNIILPNELKVRSLPKSVQYRTPHTKKDENGNKIVMTELFEVIENKISKFTSQTGMKIKKDNGEILSINDKFDSVMNYFYNNNQDMIFSKDKKDDELVWLEYKLNRINQDINNQIKLYYDIKRENKYDGIVNKKVDNIIKLIQHYNIKKSETKNLIKTINNID